MSTILILHGWGSCAKNWSKAKELLESKGYEVIYLSIDNVTSITPAIIYWDDKNNFPCNTLESCVFKEIFVTVEMKSMGNRAEQIIAVITNSVSVENLYGLWITIHSPLNTCDYVINFEDWKNCLNDRTYSCDIDKLVTEDSLLLCE